ncbi:hypothetical protein PSA7680_01663 [Pseudoruegeria aquimaris]|uniref:Uncharacterized protein n=1 Tax=Pseudoruegeria aquimaris TaxID=393663 RepID=A0A1Y5S8T8_9RHOB|nr:hypothetical protein [Pseudoruegeria aquimaris]SLN35049.1 hypothetical protein PSA7680_01663 [Pseudoruegeria aquimaris]
MTVFRKSALALAIALAPVAAQAQFVGMGATLSATAQISPSLEKSCFDNPPCPGQQVDTTRADTAVLIQPATPDKK